MSKAKLPDPFRCDGCGEETAALTQHRDDEGTVVAKSCPGCEGLRGLRNIKPGDHDQYKLMVVST